MKLLITIFFIVIYAQVNADTVIGERCYAVEPHGAPQDNGTEKLYVVERGVAGSGIFDSVGYHQDLAGLRTPIHVTSIRVIDSVTGAIQYNRVAFGVLGDVSREISYANLGNVYAMFYFAHNMANFVSYSTLVDDQAGNVRGTFRTDVWHHDLPTVEVVPAFNAQPWGVIYSITCS
jgi:hypothetical protein